MGILKGTIGVSTQTWETDTGGGGGKNVVIHEKRKKKRGRREGGEGKLLMAKDTRDNVRSENEKEWHWVGKDQRGREKPRATE